MLYDLIIIGAGPAGLSAAIYAARKKLKLLVLGTAIGGQTIEAHKVENYLGLPGLSGMELAAKFKEHAQKFDIKIKDGTAVNKIINTDSGFEVKTDEESFLTTSIIVASGKNYRKLDIPGAKEFEGRGITYCATCDAPLFKNKTVAVIGAGDAGQDTAWQLTKYAAKIYLLNKYDHLRGQDVHTQERLKTSEKIEIYNECEPLQIKGDKFVTGIVFKHNGLGETKEIAVNGVFVAIGSIATSDFLPDVVKLNEKQEIKIDHQTNATSCPGLFAAGDVTDQSHKQMIIAAGEGAKAALSAYEYLKQNN